MKFENYTVNSQRRALEIRDLLYDPNFDVSARGYSIIEEIRDLDTFPDIKKKIVYALMVRLYAKSPPVYAITVGQFGRWFDENKFHPERGIDDGFGYLWLIRKR